MTDIDPTSQTIGQLQAQVAALSAQMTEVLKQLAELNGSKSKATGFLLAIAAVWTVFVGAGTWFLDHFWRVQQ